MEFRVHHVAISVLDIQESISFYEIFGFKVVVHYVDPDGAFEIAHLKLGESVLEIFWYREQTPAPESAANLSTDLPRIGVKHFGLQSDSIDEIKALVEERGLAQDVEVRQGKTGITYFFIKDPSGNLLEFVEDKRNL
ncbi:VOC family protein [Streptomyces sp. BK205]|uniref:VOC family protein n=1 Tax=Streptomyces sp. BK205 TaxID=2512164 RepID=UPI00104AF1B4|nr:VOC family protein [Streptomyces sp. BK205]TCR24000.1 catechol 2,3-dioxygenase-like lactoylglutathione lyase family enzyme [Streptomyces sp. BK205]